MDTDIVRLLAIWELVHESADEGLKASIARGAAQSAGEMRDDPGAFVDGLTALVDARKEEIKSSLADEAEGGGAGLPGSQQESAADSKVLSELQFEIAELRGRVESLTTSIDALRSQLEH